MLVWFVAPLHIIDCTYQNHISFVSLFRSSFDTPEWKTCISQPSLPYVLKMLKGLCRSHSKTQLAIVPVIPQVHLLEQVASDQHIGTMAENLLEAMMENPTCQAEVSTCMYVQRKVHYDSADLESLLCVKLFFSCDSSIILMVSQLVLFSLSFLSLSLLLNLSPSLSVSVD